MSITREEYLVDCLKNVSLQRLRTLKMDMDKLARDSRIGNDRAFWSLLEFHNIRLDERTKREFYKQVSDSRGVNVTSAIKNLRRAQGKTGRDSVEVLEKNDSPVLPKENKTIVKVTPAATPLKLEIPKTTTGTRNYKLDKFRAKAMGIGKLRAAFKMTTPLKAMKDDSNDVKMEEPNKNENPDSKGETSKQIYSFPNSNKETESNIEKAASPTQDTAKNVTEKIQKKEDIDNGTNASEGNNQPGSFLQLLLEENVAEKIKQRNLDKSATPEQEAENVFSSAKNPDINKDKSNTQTFVMDTEVAKSPDVVQTQNNPGVVTHTSDASDSTDISRKSDCDENSKDSVEENFKNFKMETQESVSPVIAKVQSDKRNEDVEIIKDETLTQPTPNNQLKEEAKSEEEKSNEIDFSVKSITEQASDKEENATKSQEDDKVSQSLAVEEDKNNSTEQSTTADVLKAGDVTTEQDNFSFNGVSQTQATADTNILTTDLVKQSDGLDKKENTTKYHDQDNEHDNKNSSTDDAALATSATDLKTTDIPLTPTSNSDEVDKTIEEEVPSDVFASNLADVKSKEVASDQTVQPTKKEKADESKTAEDVKSNEENKTVRAEIAEKNPEPILDKKEKRKNLTDEKNNVESKRKRKKKLKLQSEKSSEHKNIDKKEDLAASAKSMIDCADGADDTTKADKDVSEKTVIQINVEVKRAGVVNDKEVESQENQLDTCSVSSHSSEDDNLTLDDALRSVSSDPDVTEKVYFGDVCVELTGSERLSKKRKQLDRKNAPELQLDWVYGCNTVHSQCMTSSKNGELIYYAGCVIIVYNVVRKAQRHYLEHSSFITCVATHPSDILVASSQEESSRKNNSNLLTQSDRYSSCHGSAHVRVWNAVTLETVRTIGFGTLRSPVYRMQFLNNSNYFITIEHNEDSTMTVWDGGCRVTSKSTSFSEPQTNVEASQANTTKTAKKRFVPALATRHQRSLINKTKPTKLREERTHLLDHSKPVNGPRAIAGSLCEELEFVTAGKSHLSFWMLKENEEDDGSTLEGIAISEPEYGDFGTNFFRAEYISTCVATSKFLDAGSILTGDSNGTLLMWSEKSKSATRGYPHAHECHISSICISDDGCIFTSGVKDRLVKAFNLRKSKIDKCGFIKIPSDLGSATCLVCVESTLFIATEKNLILSVAIETATTAQVGASMPVPTKPTLKLSSRSYSFGSGLHKNPTQATTKSVQNEATTDTADSGIFAKFDSHELAKGFCKGMKQVCSLGTLKAKFLHQTDQTSDVSTVPSIEEGISIIRQQMARSAGVRKQLNEQSAQSSRPGKAVYAWKGNETGPDDGSPRKPIPSASSPRLLTNERMLLKEKARFDELQKSLPLFALTNQVTTRKVFREDEETNFTLDDSFVTSSSDGWLAIYSIQEHIILGRFKLSLTGKITSMEVYPRRHLVAVGTDTGHVAVIRINLKKFEVLSTVKCRCSGGGSPNIVALRFSPNGKKLAVSVGYDVIIFQSKVPLLSEHGRCIGHQSNFIRYLDWSKNKYSGTYFLRSGATNPIPEVKLWHTDTTLEVRDIVATVEWETNSCVLDYSTKGMWDEYSNPSDVVCAVISKTSSNSEHASEARNSKLTRLSSDNLATEKFLYVGDKTGRLIVQLYPCLRWETVNRDKASESYHDQRAHCTPIQSISVSCSGNYLFTTSEDGCAIVQWAIMMD